MIHLLGILLIFLECLVKGCVFNGIGQSNFMWYLRTNKRILDIFKKVYKTDELVTSFDGCSLFCSNKQQSKSWHHIDQNPKNKIESYQSSYNYYPVTEKSSGFITMFFFNPFF